MAIRGLRGIGYKIAKKGGCSAPLWPQGYKTFFVLNSTEHRIYLAHNVKMPTIVGILTFMSMIQHLRDLKLPVEASLFVSILVFMSS